MSEEQREDAGPIALFGATGGTGLALLARAVWSGRAVRAAVRDATRLGRFQDEPRVVPVPVSLADPASVASVIAGASAVVSALGPRGLDPKGVYRTAFASIVAAMRATGTRRLVVITSSGHERDPSFPLFFKAFVKPLILRRIYRDMAAAERIVEASDLDWTIVRPSMFVAHDEARRFRVEDRLNPRGGWKISREHTAEFILRELGERRWIHKHPALAY